MDIKNIASNFNFISEPVSVKEFGSGHINSTYIADCVEKKYVIQEVNHNVFKDVEGLMNNVFSVTNYLKKKYKEYGGDYERETLNFVKTKDGEKFFVDDGSYYRSYVFVKDSICYDSADTAELFGRSGTAFGKFQRLLTDFPADTLVETIPHFHDTYWRYENEFLPALQNAAEERKEACKAEIDFIKSRKDEMKKITSLIDAGEIPLRVTHNDTKLNNILFDEKTGESLAVIDLDTVMPGSALYDFGDSIRFGASTAAEDEKDLDKVSINLDYFKAYAEGFLSQAGEVFTKAETENLAFSSKLITLELAMRFLSDFLNGDVYFKTDYPEHNLVRAKNQLRLVEDIESKLDEMNDIIRQTVKE